MKPACAHGPPAVGGSPSLIASNHDLPARAPDGANSQRPAVCVSRRRGGELLRPALPAVPGTGGASGGGTGGSAGTGAGGGGGRGGHGGHGVTGRGGSAAAVPGRQLRRPRQRLPPRRHRRRRRRRWRRMAGAAGSSPSACPGLPTRLAVARTGMGATTVGGRIYLLGGRVVGGRPCHAPLMAYDPADNSYHPLASVPGDLLQRARLRLLRQPAVRYRPHALALRHRHRPLVPEKGARHDDD